MKKLNEFVFLGFQQNMPLEENWSPQVDVYQGKGQWVVKIALPGVEKEDVNVQLHPDRVEVSGYRKDSMVHKGLRQLSMEIVYSKFHRSIELPESYHGALLDTRMENGMLYLDLQTMKAA